MIGRHIGSITSVIPIHIYIVGVDAGTRWVAAIAACAVEGLIQVLCLMVFIKKAINRSAYLVVKDKFFAVLLIHFLAGIPEIFYVSIPLALHVLLRIQQVTVGARISRLGCWYAAIAIAGRIADGLWRGGSLIAKRCRCICLRSIYFDGKCLAGVP